MDRLLPIACALILTVSPCLTRLSVPPPGPWLDAGLRSVVARAQSPAHRLKSQLQLTPRERERDAWLLIRREHTPAARRACISNCNPRGQIAAGLDVITKEKVNKRMALSTARK